MIDKKTREMSSGDKAQKSAGRASITMIDRVGGDWIKAKVEEGKRVEALHFHWSFQRYSVYALMMIGLGYLVWVLLRF